jgi:putative RNA 2'-phosphotransferase
MARRRVHLAETIEAARAVGARHGPPIILVVDAAAMHAEGTAFFRSASGVWLVDHVPARFLSQE